MEETKHLSTKSINSSNFYKDISQIKNLQDVSKDYNFQKVPEDWFVIVADIKGSTKAIEDGKYKDVNTIGALSIISILNLDKSVDIPFVFGGDGAFLLIPPNLHNLSKQALLAVKKISLDSYGLHLRIATVLIKDIYQKGKNLYITKIKISDNYFQAIIKGGGLELCDELVKSHSSYEITDIVDQNFKLNINGLECRWKSIPSPKEITLSILIKAKDDNYYKDILDNVDSILGDKITRHPINQKDMQLSFDDKNLNTEASIYYQESLSKKIFLIKLKLINLIGKFLMKFNVGKWGLYKNRIVSTTDTEKFDDILRMTVSTTILQTEQLEKYLEKEYSNKNLIFGIHKANSSMMTCLIFERHGKHIHFVDGANGGYALAAKMLKKQYNG